MIEMLQMVRKTLEAVKQQNIHKMRHESDLSSVGPVAKKLGRVAGVEDCIREVDKLLSRMADGDEILDELDEE